RLIEAVDRHEFLVVARTAGSIGTADPVDRDQALMARVQRPARATLRGPPASQVATGRNAAKDDDHRRMLRAPGLPGQCAIVEFQATGQAESAQRQDAAQGRRTRVLDKLLADWYRRHDALCRCVQGAATLRRAE